MTESYIFHWGSFGTVFDISFQKDYSLWEFSASKNFFNHFLSVCGLGTREDDGATFPRLLSSWRKLQAFPFVRWLTIINDFAHLFICSLLPPGNQKSNRNWNLCAHRRTSRASRNCDLQRSTTRSSSTMIIHCRISPEFSQFLDRFWIVWIVGIWRCIATGTSTILSLWSPSNADILSFPSLYQHSSFNSFVSGLKTSCPDLLIFLYLYHGLQLVITRRQWILIDFLFVHCQYSFNTT